MIVLGFAVLLGSAPLLKGSPEDAPAKRSKSEQTPQPQPLSIPFIYRSRG